MLKRVRNDIWMDGERGAVFREKADGWLGEIRQKKRLGEPSLCFRKIQDGLESITQTDGEFFDALNRFDIGQHITPHGTDT